MTDLDRIESNATAKDEYCVSDNAMTPRLLSTMEVKNKPKSNFFATNADLELSSERADLNRDAKKVKQYLESKGTKNEQKKLLIEQVQATGQSRSKTQLGKPPYSTALISKDNSANKRFKNQQKRLFQTPYLDTKIQLSEVTSAFTDAPKNMNKSTSTGVVKLQKDLDAVLQSIKQMNKSKRSRANRTMSQTQNSPSQVRYNDDSSLEGDTKRVISQSRLKPIQKRNLGYASTMKTNNNWAKSKIALASHSQSRPKVKPTVVEKVETLVNNRIIEYNNVKSPSVRKILTAMRQHSVVNGDIKNLSGIPFTSNFSQPGYTEEALKSRGSRGSLEQSPKRSNLIIRRKQKKNLRKQFQTLQNTVSEMQNTTESQFTVKRESTGPETICNSVEKTSNSQSVLPDVHDKANEMRLEDLTPVQVESNHFRQVSLPKLFQIKTTVTKKQQKVESLSIAKKVYKHQLPFHKLSHSRSGFASLQDSGTAAIYDSRKTTQSKKVPQKSHIAAKSAVNIHLPVDLGNESKKLKHHKIRKISKQEPKDQPYGDQAERRQTPGFKSRPETNQSDTSKISTINLNESQPRLTEEEEQSQTQSVLELAETEKSKPIEFKPTQRKLKDNKQQRKLHKSVQKMKHDHEVKLLIAKASSYYEKSLMFQEAKRAKRDLKKLQQKQQQKEMKSIRKRKELMKSHSGILRQIKASKAGTPSPERIQIEC